MTRDTEWEDETKGIKPLASKSRHVAPRARLNKKPLPEAITLPEASVRAPLADVDVGRAEGISAKARKRLLRGDVEIHATLDLHGMTAEEAHRHFMRWLAVQLQRGARSVLIITGKGKGEHGGVLKRALQAWVNMPDVRPHIVTMVQAPQHMGGSGAFVLYLRKNLTT